jgi:hypothetical protein
MRESPGKKRMTNKPVFSFFSEILLLFQFNEKNTDIGFVTRALTKPI